MTNNSLPAAQTEARVLKVVEQLRAGQPVEDSRTELKREFPTPAAAARRIAAALNAASGSTVLFIFGVDEKAAPEGVVHGIADVDFGQWWSRVCAEFVELAPSAQDLAIPVDAQTVVAVSIQSDRAPYVVKNPQYGTKGHSIWYEVPWRDGTLTRSAKRSELLQILVPAVDLPEVSVRHGTVEWIRREVRSGMPYLSATMELYLTVRPNLHDLTIPDENLRVTANLADRSVALREATLKAIPYGRAAASAANAHSGGGQVVIHGSGPVTLEARSWPLEGMYEPPADEWIDLDLSIRPAGASQAATLSDVGLVRSAAGASWNFPVC